MTTKKIAMIIERQRKSKRSMLHGLKLDWKLSADWQTTKQQGMCDLFAALRRKDSVRPISDQEIAE